MRTVRRSPGVRARRSCFCGEPARPALASVAMKNATTTASVHNTTTATPLMPDTRARIAPQQRAALPKMHTASSRCIRPVSHELHAVLLGLRGHEPGRGEDRCQLTAVESFEHAGRWRLGRVESTVVPDVHYVPRGAITEQGRQVARMDARGERCGPGSPRRCISNGTDHITQEHDNEGQHRERCNYGKGQQQAKRGCGAAEQRDRRKRKSAGLQESGKPHACSLAHLLAHALPPIGNGPRRIRATREQRTRAASLAQAADGRGVSAPGGSPRTSSAAADSRSCDRSAERALPESRSSRRGGRSG